MAKLALRHCTPIKKGTKPISTTIARSLIKQLDPGWSFHGDVKGLEQEFRFKNFHETMGFVNAVAWIANTEDHHPDLEIGYDRCRIRLSTHAAGGLTVNDFICAAKIDALYHGSPEGTATAEKTRALVEPGPKTGMTAARLVAKAPELDISEAEALLRTEIRTPAPEPESATDEDELILRDPDDEPTQPHLHNPPPKESSAAPAGTPRPGAAAEKPKPKAATTSQPQQTPSAQGVPPAHMLTTVILPPGMQSIRRDPDEEATVISQPDFGDENIELTALDDADEVRTQVVTGAEAAFDNTEEEDPELMKTMIIKPPLFDHKKALDDETVLDDENDGDETLLINPDATGPDKFK